MEKRNRKSHTITNRKGEYVLLLADILWNNLGNDNILSSKDLVVVHNSNGFPVHFYNPVHWNPSKIYPAAKDGGAI